ncbi:MAG: phosphodiester glycosidase family protein [Clostridia bacterium]|nr:phosphodiester glycosidase family protein [Clostridia bacterium]
MKKKGHALLCILLSLLLAFTSYVLLDTFVIVRRIETAVPQAVTETTQEPMAEASAEPEAAAETQPDAGNTPVPEATPDSGENDQTAADSLPAVQDENTYRDGNISVVLTQERVGDTTVYIADVQLASAEYLKTAFAENTYGRNVTDKTSSIADSVHAILAVNGDFYGAQQSGYVIRNGVLYRDTAKRDAQDLVIYQDGSFAVIREAEITAEELMEQGARDVLSFGPALVEDGEIAVTVNDEVGRAKASNPRTAIAVLDELHYLFVVSDGRTAESEGLSLYELAAFLKDKGAVTAYNLDGGGSSTMVFNGEVINNPTSGGRGTKERSVSDIVYIG